MKRWHMLLMVLAVLGMIDAGYLGFEHFQNSLPPCSINPLFADCGKVLKSEYAVVLSIPLALIGFVHYAVLTTVSIIALFFQKRKARSLLVLLTTIGFGSSLYFIYLQLFVIHAICFYCMLSALISVTLFLFVQFVYRTERKIVIVLIVGVLYQQLLKRLLFLFNPEFVHNRMTHTGYLLGKNALAKKILSYGLSYQHASLRQSFHGLSFANPIGLSAGFDYEGKLTQVLPSISFGFATIGTITNHQCSGNPRPMLGRLPQSRSLMVNKGFKNLGAKETIARIRMLSFAMPIGISIGRTNRKEAMTLKESITDIIQAFVTFEKSTMKHSYYELNISCPNLYGTVSFYPPKHLNELLTMVDKLHLRRPLFIKMPIEKSDAEVLEMLPIIANHAATGVIFGNLQKDRSHPSLMPSEVRKFAVGNFSGKPTFDRSNELIRLTYCHYKERFTIIGAGGVFSAEDAYEKICSGASLVQLITGMIYQGPQLIAALNIGLVDLLKKDGFTHISQAIGTKKIASIANRSIWKN